MSEPGEWKCNQKSEEWRLRQADVESEGGKGGGGGEQNRWEQLQGGQRNLHPMQHALWEPRSSGFRKKKPMFLFILLMV